MPHDKQSIAEICAQANITPLSLQDESKLGLVLRVAATDVVATLAALKEATPPFEQLLDLFGADLIADHGVIEITYRVRSLAANSDLIIKTSLESGAILASVTSLYGAALLPEREVCEMFGLKLAGHPNPKYMLLAEDVPPLLRKDVPIRSREQLWAEDDRRRAEGMTFAQTATDPLIAETGNAPELGDALKGHDPSLDLFERFLKRGIVPPDDPDDPLANYQFPGWLSPEPPEGPVVPRNPFALQDDSAAFPADHYLMHMGPSHPSTHGVLNLILELDGERIISSEAHIGNVHRGIEKLAESRRYEQLGTLVDRGDYVGGISNELSVALAVEQLAEIEVPERASWIRVLMSEVNRIASHYIWFGPSGLDSGAMGIMLFSLWDREMWLDVLEEVTGQRMMFNYVRPGGVVNDITPKTEAMCRKILKVAADRVEEHYESLLTSEIYQERTKGVGVISKEMALNFGASGFIARASGVDWDLRRDRPYAAYDKMDFDVLTMTDGDIWSRMFIRLDEIRQSLKIIEQCLDGMPEGPYRAKMPRVLRVPAGEAFVPVEAPRGEMDAHIYSDGSDKPFRMHYRPPTLYSLNIADCIMPGSFIADAIVLLGSFDFCFGEIDR